MKKWQIGVAAGLLRAIPGGGYLPRSGNLPYHRRDLLVGLPVLVGPVGRDGLAEVDGVLVLVRVAEVLDGKGELGAIERGALRVVLHVVYRAGAYRHILDSHVAHVHLHGLGRDVA